MVRCPRCYAECQAPAAACPKCRFDLPQGEEAQTLRTKPRLLLLRPAPQSLARAPDLAAGPITVPLTDSMPTPTAIAPRLRVVRGLKINAEYPLCEGQNLIGRGDDRPVDIDLRDQEPQDRVWASRNHASITVTDGQLTVEDLNSMNGTYVNRHRVYPGTMRGLKAGDVLQIGTVQLKVTM